MMTWFVATSTCEHCSTTDLDACQPLAEACRDRHIFFQKRKTARPLGGFGAGWKTAQRTTRAAAPRWLRENFTDGQCLGESPQTGGPSCANCTAGEEAVPRRRRS